jgi:hypothetical protein
VVPPAFLGCGGDRQKLDGRAYETLLQDGFPGG